MNKKILGALTSAMLASVVGAFALQPTAPQKAGAETREVVVAKYDFADSADLGKDSGGVGNDLAQTGNPVKDEERGGVRFDGKSVLYAEGAGEDKKGYDFMDELIDEDFSVSVDFYIDGDMDTQKSIYRAPIFTLWGHMYTSFDLNIGGAANDRGSALTVDWIENQTTAHLRFAWADGTPGAPSPDWGPLVSVSTNAWHTFSFTWDATARQAVGTMDGNAYFDLPAKAGHSFRSNVARFTLGGYYTDPLNGGKGIQDGETYSAFKGSIKNVSVKQYVTDGNKYNKFVSYDFRDAGNLGKANDAAYDLAEWGEGAAYDAEKQAIYSPLNSVFVPKGFNTLWYSSHDFMDYLAGSDWTVSTSFMLPKNLADGQAADGRGVLFSLWGLWPGRTFGDSNLVASSVVYDAYASGAEQANIRIGFLYQEGTNDDGSARTQNGWWSNKEKQVSTDEFHSLALSMQGLTLTVYLDGVQMVSFDCYEGNEWGRTETTFALGGAAGFGGTEGGCAYFRYFDIYDFAMSGKEMAALQKGKLSAVDAAYIAGAADVESSVSVNFNAEDEEILSGAPTVSDVTLTLSDGTERIAKAVWTGVERQGAEVCLVGNILGAKASNIYNIKAKMPVTLQTVEAAAPFIAYEFDDAENPGKSNKGGLYDLIGTENGTVTVQDGYAELKKAVLRAQTDINGCDFMDYMHDFTIETEFKLPKGIEQPHTKIISVYNGGNVQKDSAVIMVNNYGEASVEATLRVGFAYESVESGDGSDGKYANAAYWSKYNANIALGVWNKIAFSYNAQERTIVFYLNGAEVCSYEVTKDAVFAGEGHFELGTANGSVIYRSVKIYDYIPASESLSVLSKAGVMPKGAEAAAEAEKLVSASKLSFSVSEAGLTAEKALRVVQEGNRTVRVETQSGNLLKLNVLWESATLREDGTYLVSGIVLGGYNPDNVIAEATVKLAENKVSFVAENATVKTGGEEIGEISVQFGGSVKFAVEVEDGYSLKSVKAGETELVAENGVYKIENITEALIVTIETEKDVPVPPPDSSSDSVSASDSVGSSSTGTGGNSSSATSSDGGSVSSGCGSVAFGGAASGMAAVVAVLIAKGRKKSE